MNRDWVWSVEGVSMKNWIQKLCYKRKLREMDEMWRLMGGSSWGLFPPSFYLTHSPEEVQRRKKEELDKLKAMLEEFKKKTAFELFSTQK